MSELFQKVRVLDPVSGTDQITDVLIIDGVIRAVQPQITDLPDHTSVRDCQGLILAPGLVDLYSHSGEPGFEERETLTSLMKAAKAGGFTRLSILPDTTPPIDNPAVLAQLQKVKIPHSPFPIPHSQLFFWGAMTVDLAGQKMTELAELASAGVVGFADGQPVQNLGLLHQLLTYLQPLNKPVALFPLSRALAGNGVMREGADSIRFGLPRIPAIAETSALAALLEVVAMTTTPVHIMRVSTARSVELIQSAKARGLPITASTTWMHLLFNTQAISSYDPNLRLEPPLGTMEDQRALIQALKSGVLDAIAIDHTPYSYEEKTVSFAEAPPGVIGLELALPLLWQNLVETEDLSALELWRVLSMNPAQCLQQKPGVIAPGELAEIILFAPQETWKVDAQNLYSLSANTPWWGKELRGRVLSGGF